jgi:hypothetical protein
MATAKRKQSGFITLRLNQDEADLIRSVFGDLYHQGSMPRERDVVSDIYYALNEYTQTRGYNLRLSDAGKHRPQF